MPSIVQLATVQFAPVKGEYETNLHRFGEIFAQAAALPTPPQVLHFPEASVTGYFVEGAVREIAVTAGTLARDLQRVYLAAVPDAPMLEVVLGFYEDWGHNLHNSAMCVRLGGDEPLIRYVHRKNFLPTYGVFDEERFVERGHGVRAFDAPWGRSAILVCEDAWHQITSMLLALDDVEIIFVCSAAPARGTWPRGDGIPGPASVARWEQLICGIAGAYGVFVSFANLATSEGGKSFPGGSLIAGPRGGVRLRGPLWREAMLSLPVDLDDIMPARTDLPLLADLRAELPHLLDSLSHIRQGDPPIIAYDAATTGATEDESNEAPRSRHAPSGKEARLEVVRVSGAEASGPPPLSLDAPLVERWLVDFLRTEIARRGFARGIVAISGGLDSAVTASLAARALGPENVIGVRLPYRSSSKESLEHAQLVIDTLGIESRTIDISAAVDAYLTNEPDADDTRRGNVMARMRMIAIFDLAARYAALPLGTGNKTERLLGYFTWHADDTPPINPLGDLYKTQVAELARHLGVPAKIIEKPPTADLVVGQTDEGDIGISYASADVILHWLLHGY